MQKKALYVRFKGIPEGVIFLSFNIDKTLINKGFCTDTENRPLYFYNKKGADSINLLLFY
jgi:hypothetical protein